MEEAIENCIQTIWNCSIIVEDGFGAADKSVPEQTQNFHKQINRFLGDLKVLDQEAQKVHHVNVPDDVIRKIDAGHNPDSVTRDEFLMAQQKNNLARGRLFSTQIYADQLEARMKHWDLSQQFRKHTLANLKRRSLLLMGPKRRLDFVHPRTTFFRREKKMNKVMEDTLVSHACHLLCYCRTFEPRCRATELASTAKGF